MERKNDTMKKISNWLYYHWWLPVLIGVLAMMLGSMIHTQIETRRQKGDYCISYVGSEVLSEACVSSLKREIAALGEDVDGSGEVTVRIKQFIVSDTGVPGEDVAYGRTAEIALLTDISEGESYFFLVQYPEEFQRDFQLMAHMDGSPSADDDFGVWDKVCRWGDCPVLMSLEVEDGSRLEGLYLGRRCFIDPGMKANCPENQALWETLTAGAILPDGAKEKG